MSGGNGNGARESADGGDPDSDSGNVRGGERVLEGDGGTNGVDGDRAASFGLTVTRSDDPPAAGGGNGRGVEEDAFIAGGSDQPISARLGSLARGLIGRISWR